MPRDEIGGNWYGMVVCTPHWGPIEVSFEVNDGAYTGRWEFPEVDEGQAKSGKFNAVRVAHWLHVRITSAPLRGAEFRLTLVGSKSKSMIYGAIPLEGADFPFATVTLFRSKPDDTRMTGICPIARKRFKA